MVDRVECGGYLIPGSHDSDRSVVLVGDPGINCPGWVFGAEVTSCVGLAGWSVVWSTDDFDPSG